MAISSIQYQVQHALTKGGVAEPLANDQVDLLIQLQFARPTMKDLDPVRQAVGFDQIGRDLRDIGGINGVDLPCSGLGSEHSQDARADSHVQNDIARLDNFTDRRPEGVRAVPAFRTKGQGPGLVNVLWAECTTTSV